MLQSLAGQLGLLAFQADGEDMPLAPKSVDLLLSASAMQWYARPLDSALKNLGLLRPGGDFVLALFVRGTLLELVKSSQASGFGSFYPLARVKGYLQGLQKIPWLSWHFQVRNYIQWHDSVLAFLHQHKQTGANLSPGGTDRAGKTKLKRFCAYYRSCFQRQGLVPATYRVLYLYGQRKD
jgi:malonyl-CoA O-methyltransferase